MAYPDMTEHFTTAMAKKEKKSPNVSARDLESAGSSMTETDWKPSTQELLIMLSLALISLMISLDASIIITSLSVRSQI
jgi:hypothetical protein